MKQKVPEAICSKLAEEDVAMGLSPVIASAMEFVPVLPGWLSSHCEVCSGRLHRVRRIQELTLLGESDPHKVIDIKDIDKVVDPYKAWLKVHQASEFGVPASQQNEDRLGFVVHLLMKEEEELRFDAPPEGLKAMKQAVDMVREMVPDKKQDRVADSKSFGNRRRPRRGLALRALVEARYGNALRYNSRHPDARPEIAGAVFLTQTYKMPHFVDAEVHWLYAVCLTDSGQQPLALETIHRSLDGYRSAGDLHRAATVMITLADILYRNGFSANDVVQILDKTLRDLDALRSAHMYYGCQLQYVDYSIKANATSSAEQVWRLLPKSDKKTTEIYRKSLGGLIHLAKGELEEAITRLTSCGTEFLEVGMINNASILMLYKGEAFLRQGQSQKGLEQLKIAFDIISSLEVCSTSKRSFRELIQVAQVATAEQLIARIRSQVKVMEGVPPVLARHPPEAKISRRD